MSPIEQFKEAGLIPSAQCLSVRNLSTDQVEAFIEKFKAKMNHVGGGAMFEFLDRWIE